MLYFIIGALAVILHLIINHGYIMGNDKGIGREFRLYLLVVLVYFVSDALWGAFNSLGWMVPLNIDTYAYFLAMALSTIFLCRYVMVYFNLGDESCYLIKTVGRVFLAYEVLVLAFNIFYPIYFSFDDANVYHPQLFRYVSVSIQALLLILISVETLETSFKDGKVTSRRALVMFVYCLVMTAAVIVQVIYSLYPLYTVGMMIGSCLLSVFEQKDAEIKFRAQLIDNEQKVKENNEIIANAGYGIWKIHMSPDGHHQMVANTKLQEILGVRGMDLSPEELYIFYHERLQEDVASIEEDDYKKMEGGDHKSRTLTWRHPEKGNIYLHAGGTSFTTSSGEHVISGFCGDVTQPRKYEIRAGLIINTLARSYEFLHYIKMETMTFITTSSTLYTEKDDISEGDVRKAISFSCEQRVAPEFRKEMTAFSDLSTINDRMRHMNVIINQFKDMRGVWHEWSYIVADRNDDGSIKHLIWALRKIEDEKQAEIRKQQIIDDNIAANRAKTMFLQNMSHEIRTPLNAMFGFAQLLGLPDGTWSPEEKSQYNQYIFNSYNMLDMLIGDIIDIADSENGNYRISLSDVAVNAVCRNAIASVEYRKPENVNLYFTTEVQDDYIVRSDGKRIQQVLVNYLTNACKHTQSGAIHLHCSVSERPGKVTFSVADTGIGIPEEKSELIFKRFTKLDQFVQGSGLGLNICLMIAEKLGGEVYLDKSYKEGARFVFVIDNKR